MSVITYYFNSKSSDWANNPENMIDGSVDTDSTTTTNTQVQALDGNTCAGTDLGTISKVEIRAYGRVSSEGHDVDFKPVFNGSDDGDLHDSAITTVEGWGSYIDITGDTNAPGTWGWANVQNLDCDVIADISIVGTCTCAKVEIQVTYSATPTPDTRFGNGALNAQRILNCNL